MMPGETPAFTSPPKSLIGMRGRVEIPPDQPPHARGYLDCWDPLSPPVVVRSPDPTIAEIPFSTAPMTAPLQATLPRILVGPIIGSVTSTTARVLVEVDRSFELICQAVPYSTVRQPGVAAKPELSNQKVVVQTSALPIKRPTVLIFERLAPSTHYLLTFPNAHCTVPSAGFTTRPAVDSLEFGKLRLALVAGDAAYLEPAEEKEEVRAKGERVARHLWTDLYHRIHAGEVDAVLHMGPANAAMAPAAVPRERDSSTEKDHVLAAFDLARRVSQEGCGDAETLEGVCDVFRAMWRLLLTAPGVRCVLANCANYFAMNEKEVGSWLDVLSESRHDRFVVAAAYAVYSEYIRALSQEITPLTHEDQLEVPTSAHVIHHLGSGVAVFMCDLKANKVAANLELDSEELPDVLPHLGPSQWMDLEAALAAGGAFEHVRLLLVGTQERISDPRSTWWFDECVPETLQFLRSLYDWRDARPQGARQVLLLAADSIPGPETGLSDIVFRGRPPSIARIRELSLNGVGCLEAVNRSGRGGCGSRCCSSSSNDRNFTHLGGPEKATRTKAERSLARSRKDLVAPAFSSSLSLVKLPEEFAAVHYEKAAVNAFAVVEASGRYVQCEAAEESDAMHEIFAGSYSVRASYRTKFIGAGVSKDGKICGSQLFVPVDDWEAREVTLESCCRTAKQQNCLPVWRVI